MLYVPTVGLIAGETDSTKARIAPERIWERRNHRISATGILELDKDGCGDQDDERSRQVICADLVHADK
jgi:hypothetical protein